MSGVETVRVPLRLDVCTRESGTEALYALAAGIRAFEQSLLDLFSTGALAGTTHTCIGQETIAVGVVSSIDRERDVVFSNHRGHGHFLAYCGEIERLYLELLGKPLGVCGGRGGSQHLQYRNFYSNGVQGGIVPVATGMALAEKHKKSGAVVVVFLGDGTLGEGVVYEAFNIASLWQLPILFAIEHNGYAQSTPSRLQIAGEVAARPAAFGIPVTGCSGADVGDVIRTASSALDDVRRGTGPRCVVFDTYRLAPHSKGDDTRSADELALAWSRDPLASVRNAVADAARADAIAREVATLVEAARQRALNS